MNTLQDTVRAVVEDLVHTEQLFTALDVSNKVKVQLPNVRHRDVRDQVRVLFDTWMTSMDYERTPITVTLEDGSTAKAMLYHSVDLWDEDLDKLYDQQKRSQVAIKPIAPTPLTNIASVATMAPMPGAATVTIAMTAPVPMPKAHELWSSLFATQPSLFPTK